MPLRRLNDSAFDAQLAGVYFGMWNGSTSVRCFVSHEALTDKAQGSGQAESLDVFHEYRGGGWPMIRAAGVSAQLLLSRPEHDRIIPLLSCVSATPHLKRE